LAFTFLSPLLTAEEKSRIRELARMIRARLHWIRSREYLEPQFKKNTIHRCYYCKKSRFAQARGLKKEMNISFLLDGTNADDLRVYRPGIRAAREARVLSPLALEGWSKADIRQISRDLGLPTWDLPSSPCLASRVAYGQPITLPLLRRLRLGEEALRQMGFSQCRLRYHGSIVRIEVPEEEQSLFLQGKGKQPLVDRLSELGFAHITLDLKGFRSGSLDEYLKIPGRHKRIEP